MQLDGAVGAVHAGDVQHPPVAAVLAGQRSREVQWSVLVGGEWAVLLAVGLGAGAAGERLHGVAAQGLLVEPHEDEAASDVRLDSVDAVEPQQLAADLVHAAAALGGSGEQEGELEDALGHGRPPPLGGRLAGLPDRSASPERSSGPCSMCSRVMSSSTRICASSGE